jgi:hypothetical protein
MKRASIAPEFVEYIPPELDEGVLYVSIPYATAIHLCACGCGNKVVTPISPVEWQLLYDGESVSLTPSIGNWEFPCHSHYWIRHDEIQWARRWSDEEIAGGRRRDAEDLENYFAGRGVKAVDASVPVTQPRRSILHRLKRLFRLR